MSESSITEAKTQLTRLIHQAERGEVVIGPSALRLIGDKVEISQWRHEPDTEQKYGVVTQLLEAHRLQVEGSLQPIHAPESLSEDQLRPGC